MGIRSVDGYAKQFMDGGSALVTSRAAIAPWANMFQAIIFGSLVLEAIVFRGWSSTAFLAVASVLLGSWLTTMVVRTTLTATHLHVQHGFFGPRIAIEDIEEVRVLRARPWHWLRRHAYLAVGVKHAVAIRYRENGSPRSALVSMRDPEALVCALDRLRAIRVDIALAAEFAHEDHGEDVEEEIERELRA